MKAYKALQNYFNNQYFGNVKVLKQAFYDACANNVCKDTLNNFLNFLSGDMEDNNCDLLLYMYEGALNIQTPFY